MSSLPTTSCATTAWRSASATIWALPGTSFGRNPGSKAGCSRSCSHPSSAVGVASLASKLDPEKGAKRADGLLVGGVGVGIARTYDDDLKLGILTAAGRQHGRRQPIAFAVAQGEIDRHGALDMGFTADIALDGIGP